MSKQNQELEKLYSEYEKLKTEAKERQDRAKEMKEEIVNIMNEMGVDEVTINGWDGLIILEITYPEKEVLNKKGLAEALNIKQKELSRPQSIIQLTQEGKLKPYRIDYETKEQHLKQWGE